MHIRKFSKLINDLLESDKNTIVNVEYDVFDTYDKINHLEEYNDVEKAKRFSKTYTAATGNASLVVKVTTTIEIVQEYPE